MKLIFSERSLKRMGLPAERAHLWDRELRVVGGIRLLGFAINNTAELITLAVATASLLLLVAVAGTITGGLNPANFLLISAGSAILFYTSWRGPIEAYKDSFLKDTELPVAVEMFISGLEAGMNVEGVLLLLSKNLKGVVGKLFWVAQNEIEAGKSVRDVLDEAAENGMNMYFTRFIALLADGRETGGGDTRQYLEEFLEEIEEVRGNERIERAGRLDNNLFFPIFLGYFLPIIVIFSLPFILSLGGLFEMF